MKKMCGTPSNGFTPIEIENASGELSFTLTSDGGTEYWGYRATVQYTKIAVYHTPLRPLFPAVKCFALGVELVAVGGSLEGLDQLAAGYRSTKRLDLTGTCSHLAASDLSAKAVGELASLYADAEVVFAPNNLTDEQTTAMIGAMHTKPLVFTTVQACVVDSAIAEHARTKSLDLSKAAFSDLTVYELEQLLQLAGVGRHTLTLTLLNKPSPAATSLPHVW